MATGYDPFMTDNDPAVDRVGIVCERQPDGAWSASMTITEHDVNAHGVCHGGVVFLLADAVFDRVTNSDLPDGQTAFAANANIEFVRAGAVGDTITAIGSARDRWGRSTLVDVVVTNGADETVAHFRGKTRTVNTDR